MYPDLSYVLHDLFGTPVDNWTSLVKTFGFFLALAFLTAAWFFWLELRRKSAQGYFPTSAVKGDKGGTVQVYPHDRVGDITIVAAVSGLLGAKIFAILESAENIKAFLDDPISNFFTGSGLAIYGGLIFGFIGVFWFVRKKLRVNPIYMMDAIAPALMFAYGVGRIGCQLAGDGDWGIDNPNAAPAGWFLPRWLWSFSYPRNVINSAGHPHELIAGFTGHYNTFLTPPVYPTPVYEMAMAFAIGGVLWALRKQFRVHGILFMVYLILNGIERFFIEKIRVNDKIHALGLTFTQAELIAVLFFLTGVVGIIVLQRRGNRNEPFPAYGSADLNIE